MAKIFLIVALIATLISSTLAANVTITVGAGGKNAFDPLVAKASPGDMLVFTWNSGMHSVIQSDAAKSCAKSASFDAKTSIFQAAVASPNTYVYTIPTTATGKMWYYCGVATHCSADGMYGTIDLTGGSAAPTSSGAAATGTAATGTATGTDAAATTKSAADKNLSNLFFATLAIAGVIGLLI